MQWCYIELFLHILIVSLFCWTAVAPILGCKHPSMQGSRRATKTKGRKGEKKREATSIWGLDLLLIWARLASVATPTSKGMICLVDFFLPNFLPLFSFWRSEDEPSFWREDTLFPMQHSIPPMLCTITHERPTGGWPCIFTLLVGGARKTGGTKALNCNSCLLFLAVYPCWSPFFSL